MTCPSCGLENPPSAQVCDCGYAFVPGSIKPITNASQPATKKPLTTGQKGCVGCLGLVVVLVVLLIVAGRSGTNREPKNGSYSTAEYMAQDFVKRVLKAP